MTIFPNGSNGAVGHLALVISPPSTSSNQAASPSWIPSTLAPITSIQMPLPNNTSPSVIVTPSNTRRSTTPTEGKKPHSKKKTSFGRRPQRVPKRSGLVQALIAVKLRGNLVTTPFFLASVV